MNKHPTPKEAKFIVAMVEGKTQNEAYHAGYDTQNMSEATVSARAWEVLQRPHVAAKIRELQDAAAESAMLTASWVLRQWAEVATADAAELSRPRRVCCRNCWGFAHGYQWRDMAEWTAEAERLARIGQAPPELDGGVGFRGNRVPHPECPRCDGEGHEQVFLADLANVSGAARRLYAGVKRTRDGWEVKTRSQDDALKNIAVYLGMLAVKVQQSGAVGVVNLDGVELTDAQREALAGIVKGLL